MEKGITTGLELQIKQLQLLHKISCIWTAKSKPDIPCFEIGMGPDGTYNLTFLNDMKKIISEPYLLFIDEKLNITLAENMTVITYNFETGELLSGDIAYVPAISIIETADQWREYLSIRLEEADDQVEKDTLEYNRRIILSWLCCEWMPEGKSDVPNLLISKNIPTEYEIRFLKDGKSILPEAFTIEQEYEMFFFRLEDNCININYLPAVDQLLVGGTYYVRVAVQRQEL